METEPGPITPGQDWRTLPRQISTEQAQAWLGLSHNQWFAARDRREIREAVVWGTGGKGLRFWTVKLAKLVPAPEEARTA